ncbi:hypothetical protein GOBAR_AA12630 [Gossypium barbadense]|uniref:Uncharacterized protein n=1 Tax=Gossypium barbadense TaxID=3634 RepID=A0A2P5XXF2_GOSBA|nr:hypothetical protein GOBAR_AA12630 [Gossypium barbadense]
MAQADDNYAPPVFAFPKAPLSFKRIRGMSSLGKCQCQPSRVLSPLVFFPISTHFTTPPEIPSAPIVLKLGSFHRLSRVEPWDLTVDLKTPTDALRPIILDNACIFRCLFSRYRHCFFFKKKDSRPCLSPNMADHPLEPAANHHLGKLLPHQLANQTVGSYALLTCPPLETPLPIRLACVKHAVSVHPELESNSP